MRFLSNSDIIDSRKYRGVSHENRYRNCSKCRIKPITEVVEKVGIGFDDLELYGKYKAKLSFDKINAVKDNKPGKLILVTAINPTPAGEGINHVNWSCRRS